VQEYPLIDLRDLQDSTRLLGGEAMHVSEFDDRALAGRERVDARADLTLCLFGQEPVIWPPRSSYVGTTPNHLATAVRRLAESARAQLTDQMGLRQDPRPLRRGCCVARALPSSSRR
jgi:hypothetical protein